MRKVLLVGCGHMGSALLDAWLIKKKYSFTVIDPYNFKVLKKKFKNKKIIILNSIANRLDCKQFDIIIFAVKPQSASNVLKEYKHFKFKKNSVVVSIIAGKKISFYKKNLTNAHQIVRVMPNMPAAIKEGLSCLVSNKVVSRENKYRIDDLFSAVGKNIWLKTENQLDNATALSGSGPGFIFTLIDAFEKGSIRIGFSKKLSREMILKTLIGSAKLMQKVDQDPEKLANLIAVKGGTTEAGIKVLKKNNIKKIIYNTLLASYKKASKIGKIKDD
tara:strand:+ start:2670 stop:3491 length:822 start_codon:yes stop_codon:yes gene_type:complete